MSEDGSDIGPCESGALPLEDEKRIIPSRVTNYPVAL